MNNITIIAAIVLLGGFVLLVLSRYFRFKRLLGAQGSEELTGRDFGKNTGILAERILRSREQVDYQGSAGLQDREGGIRRRNAVKLVVRRTVAALVMGLVGYYIFFSRSTKAAGAIIILLVVQEIVKRLTRPEEMQEKKKPGGGQAHEVRREAEESAGSLMDEEEKEEEKEDGVEWEKEEKEEADYKSGWDSRL